jgi:hypothetical protein
MLLKVPIYTASYLAKLRKFNDDLRLFSLFFVCVFSKLKSARMCRGDTSGRGGGGEYRNTAVSSMRNNFNMAPLPPPHQPKVPCTPTYIFGEKYRVSRTYGVSIFIDYCTAPRDIEKGGRRGKRHSTDKHE